MKKHIFSKRLLLIVLSIFILAAALAYMLLFSSVEKITISDTPTLSIEMPRKIKLSESDELFLELRISNLGEALYPAASISISFDPVHLEFLGIKEGNLPVIDPEKPSSVGKLPEWSCNREQSNKSGRINIMYLDMSGGYAAFSRELLEDEEYIVLRLGFRVRGNVRGGDVYELCIEDAVFAASDESLSLAANNNTLKTKNSRIVIGE